MKFAVDICSDLGWTRNLISGWALETLNKDMRSNLQCLRSETGDMGRYLPRLRFFISDPNELTEPKFNTHKPKDLYNFIKKFLFQFFLAKTGCQKTAFFHFFKMSFRGLSIKKTKENGFRKSFKTIKNLF